MKLKLIVFLSVGASLLAGFLLQAADKHAVEVQVRRILLDPSSGTPVVILESRQEKEIVPIWIGKFEATSIALQLEHKNLPRPNTHDLIRNILGALDAKLDRITITELRNSTYYAVITLKVRGRELHIDARPSDAIAVALRAGAPIYAAPQVLKKTPGLNEVETQGTKLRRTMGFHVQDMTPELASLLHTQTVQGVLIAEVESTSLGYKSGFRRGDVITRLNGQATNTARQLEALFEQERSRKINFQIHRDGQSLTIVVNLSP